MASSSLYRDLLRTHWGYDVFRPQQEEIIRAVVQGNDVMALLPTGGGKSLCYQVPALALEGICIVVSPLVALMKDQVEALRKRNILAEAVYSGLNYKEIDRILDNCCHGPIKLLYISPERIHSELFYERLKRMNVSLIAVDEAHCISEWGYDFRPSYLDIQKLREYKPNAPCIAVTATATPNVQADIQSKLRLKHVQVFRATFARDNLSLSCRLSEVKEQDIARHIRKEQGQGIVYVRSRKGSKDIALYLQKVGITAEFYHAGLSYTEREKAAEKWMKGLSKVIVATNAFGMGIDKANVRFVYHYDLPDSLEAYYQEGGRAGRDGQPAVCILFYHQGDFTASRKKVEISFPPVEYMKAVYQHLANYYRLAIGSAELESFDFDFEDFKRRCKLEAIPTYNALKKLEDEGFIQFNESFFSPSKAVFLLDFERLYEFQIAHPRLDVYIKALLRLYGGGMLEHYTSISESKLAYYMHVSIKEITESLSLLTKMGVLQYEPLNTNPKITFLSPRKDVSTMVFNKKRLEELKLRKVQKVEELIHYVTAPMCRMNFTQEYFGETTSAMCGMCDNCRGKLINDATIERFIKEKVINGGESLEEFVKSHPEFPSGRIYELYRAILSN